MRTRTMNWVGALMAIAGAAAACGTKSASSGSGDTQSSTGGAGGAGVGGAASSSAGGATSTSTSSTSSSSGPSSSSSTASSSGTGGQGTCSGVFPGDCGACLTTSCCAAVSQCASDPTCMDCATGQQTGSACTGNAHAVALAQCKTSKCAAQCDPAACAAAAGASCDSGFCAKERSAYGACIATCGVFPSAACVASNCGEKGSVYFDCIAQCPAFEACGDPCASACAHLANACGTTSEAACKAACPGTAPQAVWACGATTDCAYASTCPNLKDPCPAGQWLCKGSTECIAAASKCDGDEQCANGADEGVVCGGTPCPTGQKRCGGSCVACPTAGVATTECSMGACVITSCSDGYYACPSGCCAWQISDTGLTNLSGVPCSLGIDALGVPYIGLLRTSGYVVSYQRQANSTWLNKYADPAGTLQNFPTLVVDANGTPHMAYFGRPSGGAIGVQYARMSAGAWVSEPVPGASGGAIALTIDATGAPWISFQTAGIDVKVATKQGGTWTITKVASAPVLRATSIAVDPLGTPYVAYGDVTASSLVVARSSSGTWSLATVDTSAKTQYPSIALDSMGRPHVMYAAATGLRLASWDGSAWSTDEVGLIGGDGRLRYDATGAPHIAYPDSSGDLSYAKRTAGSWSARKVSQLWGTLYPDAPRPFDLALDAAGAPHFIVAHDQYPFLYIH